MTIDIERVGDGILCTFEGGATVWFQDKGDAATFGSNLILVATLGDDSLDDPISEVTG